MSFFKRRSAKKGHYGFWEENLASQTQHNQTSTSAGDSRATTTEDSSLSTELPGFTRKMERNLSVSRSGRFKAKARQRNTVLQEGTYKSAGVTTNPIIHEDMAGGAADRKTREAPPPQETVVVKAAAVVGGVPQATSSVSSTGSSRYESTSTVTVSRSGGMDQNTTSGSSYTGNTSTPPYYTGAFIDNQRLPASQPTAL